jgi:hypothetical protein
MGRLDPFDALAPFHPLRAGAVAPGLAALVGAALLVRDRGLRRAAIAAFVLALGPVLRAYGADVAPGGRGVPLPGIALTLLSPSGEGWGACLVVAAVASGLGLATVPARAPLLLLPLALAEAAFLGGTRLPTTRLAPAISERYLNERKGGVLDLPVEVAGLATAPEGSHGTYLWLQTIHHRPLPVGPAPLTTADALFGEPGVVLAIDAELGGDPFLVPSMPPGQTLRRMGVTEIVVHRDRMRGEALAVIDPVFSKLYGAPQRDHAGKLDLYRLRDDGHELAAGPVNPERLRRPTDPDILGWRPVSEYLATVLSPTPTPPSGAPAPPTGE